jgi:hypothetical protein
MLRIPLTQGKMALVDDVDSDLAAHNWCAAKDKRTYYAMRGVRKPSGKWTTIRLHAIIGRRMGLQGTVDHINCDGLDCQRSNLRAATNQQNVWNSPKRRNNPSGYIGVSLHRGRQYYAHIRHNGKLEHLGSYPLTRAGVRKAAQAYDNRCYELRGDRAVLNFPGVVNGNNTTAS